MFGLIPQSLLVGTLFKAWIVYIKSPQGASVAKRYALGDTWRIRYEKDILFSS
jgi:hypothetical protein